MPSLDGEFLKTKISLKLEEEGNDGNDEDSHGYDLTSISHNEQFFALVKRNSIVEIRNASDFTLLNRILPLNLMHFSKIIPFDKSSFILLDKNGQLFHIDEYTPIFTAIATEKIENIFPLANKGCLIKQADHFISELRLENKKAIAEFKFKAETNNLVASETKNMVAWSENMILQLKAYNTNESLGFIDLNNRAFKNNTIDKILILKDDCICCTDSYGNIYFIDTLTSAVLNQFSFEQKKSLKIAYSRFTKQVFIADELDNLHTCQMNENLQWTIQSVAGCSLKDIQILICSPVSIFVISSTGKISIAEFNLKSNTLNFNEILSSSVNSIAFSESLGIFVAFDNKIQIFSHSENGETMLTHEIKYKQHNFLIKDISVLDNNLIVLYQKGAILYKIGENISKTDFIELNCPISVKPSASNFYINDGLTKIIRINSNKFQESKLIFNSSSKYENKKLISNFSVSCCGAFFSICYNDGSVSLYQVSSDDTDDLKLTEIKLPKMDFNFSATIFSKEQPQALYLFSNNDKKAVSYNIETRILDAISLSDVLNTKYANHIKFNKFALHDNKILIGASRLGYLTVNFADKQVDFKHHFVKADYYRHNGGKLMKIEFVIPQKSYTHTNARSKVFKYGY